jgi:hypothetical protein
MGFLDRPARARWSRTAKFTLSPRGLEVESEYRERIVFSRGGEGGRSNFDSARADWAQRHNLQPDDGLYLAEVRTGPIRLSGIVAALESCGMLRSEAVAALGRLVDTGLVVAGP